MRYDILGQLQKPDGRVLCDIDSLPPAGIEVELVGNVTGRAELTHTGGDRVLARGSIAGRARLECSRCLKPFIWGFDIGFTENCALREIDDPEGYEASLDEEDAVPILDNETVDLSELVRQLITVELPYRPLCRSDCAGLCATCGADLNEGECGCPPKPTDPRWAKLQQLLDD
jgi:uncharacterized protein